MENNTELLETEYKKRLFKICESKEELKQWIKTYLKLDLLDYTIDENSNSNPISFIWDVYSSIKRGEKIKTTFVVAAARNGWKTLCASVIEFLSIVHFGKWVVHASALEAQSKWAIKYLEKFLVITDIKNYIDSDNVREKTFKNMPGNTFRHWNDAQINIAIATIKDMNGKRASVIIFDELDLINPDILSEGAMMADEDKNGYPTIFIYLSSRKSPIGPVQQKINEAALDSTDISLHKWSMVDCMKHCPDDECGLPSSDPFFINQETLEIKNNIEYNGSMISEQFKYKQISLFANCEKCPAVIICQGRANKQKSTSKMLRSKYQVKATIKNTENTEKIISQLLNLKPDSGGIIFNKFNRAEHYLPIVDVFKKVFDDRKEEVIEETLDKTSFIEFLRNEKNWIFHCGVDFGFVDRATSVLVAYNYETEVLIVLDVQYSTGLSNQDWLIHVNNNVYVKYGFDYLFPDTADASATSYANKIGMPCSSKRKPPKIETGVSWIRQKLWNVSQQKSQLFIIADKHSEMLAKDFENWTYKKGELGYIYTRYEDDDNTHELDALRYAIDSFITSRGFAPVLDFYGNYTKQISSSYLKNNSDNEVYKEAILNHFKETDDIDMEIFFK